MTYFLSDYHDNINQIYHPELTWTDPDPVHVPRQRGRRSRVGHQAFQGQLGSCFDLDHRSVTPAHDPYACGRHWRERHRRGWRWETGCTFLGRRCVVVLVLLRGGDVDFWAVFVLCRCVVVLRGSVSGGGGVIAWWKKALYIRDSDAGKNVLEISVRENCYADELSQNNRPLFGVENPTQTYVFYFFPLRIET